MVVFFVRGIFVQSAPALSLSWQKVLQGFMFHRNNLFTTDATCRTSCSGRPTWCSWSTNLLTPDRMLTMLLSVAMLISSLPWCPDALQTECAATFTEAQTFFNIAPGSVPPPGSVTPQQISAYLAQAKPPSPG